MKKTLVLASLLSGVALAENMENLNADLVYLRGANGILAGTQDFTLSYTIESLASHGGDVMSLATVPAPTASDTDATAAYRLVSQEGKYIGLKKGNDDPFSNRNYDIAADTTTGANIMTPQTGNEYVTGWVTCNTSKGSVEMKASSVGTKITISSSSENSGTSSVQVNGPTKNGGTLNNIAQNNIAFTLKDVKATTNNLTVSNLTLNGHSLADSLITGQDITSIAANNGSYAALTTFNFAIMPGTEVNNGDVIAAYYNERTSANGTANVNNNANGNFFTLTTGENDAIYLTASMGGWNYTNDTKGTVYSDSGTPRSITLSSAALSIGKEYTVIIEGASDGIQTVYLFNDEKTLLASGTYKGMMNGYTPSGTAFSTYTNKLYAAPEPATATLSLLALASLAARRRRH